MSDIEIKALEKHNKMLKEHLKDPHPWMQAYFHGLRAQDKKIRTEG